MANNTASSLILNHFLESEGKEMFVSYFKGFFVGASVSTLICSMFCGWGGWTVFFLAMMFIASLITILDGWGTFGKRAGQLLLKAIGGYLLLALGFRGATAFFFTNGITWFLLGLIILSYSGNQNGIMIAVLGAAMIFGGFMSIPAKKIHGDGSSG